MVMKKYTYQLSEDDLKRLKNVKVALGFNETAETLRRCIYITNLVVNGVHRGEHLYIRDKKGEFREVIL